MKIAVISIHDCVNAYQALTQHPVRGTALVTASGPHILQKLMLVVKDTICMSKLSRGALSPLRT